MINLTKNSISTIKHTSAHVSLEERLKNLRNGKFTEATALQNMILAVIDMPFRDYMHAYPKKYWEVMQLYDKYDPYYDDVSVGEIFAFCVKYLKGSPWKKQSISLDEACAIAHTEDNSWSKPLSTLITDLCAPLRFCYFSFHENTGDQDRCEINYKDCYEKLPDMSFFAPELSETDHIIPTKEGAFLERILSDISLEDYIGALLALEPKKLGTTMLKYNNLSHMTADMNRSFMKSFPFYHSSLDYKKKRQNNVFYCETADDYFYPFFLFPMGIIAARKARSYHLS